MKLQHMIDRYGFPVLMLVGLWVTFSLFGSTIKADDGGCGKIYPIDYILWTNMFCEVKR